MSQEAPTHSGGGDKNTSASARPTPPYRPTKKEDLNFPPRLLAMHTFTSSAHATYMYSIARIVLFKFHPGVQISFTAAAVAFVIPTAFWLVHRAIQWSTTTVPVNAQKSPMEFADYKFGLRVMVPSAIAGLLTFARRAIVEYAFSTSIFCLPQPLCFYVRH